MSVTDRLRSYVRACEVTANGGSAHCQDCRDAIIKIDRLQADAEAFRMAMLESGALDKVSQDKYFDQLRALESALSR